MELNKIYNEDCLKTMESLCDIDCVLTSPPYNTSRKGATDLSTHQCRYETFEDAMSDQEYIDWTIKLFAAFDKILKPNGSVLYNMSYSSENTWLLWNLVADIQKRTNFMVADCIVWKKKSALPNNVSPNKLTRICEFVFVFCRKEEFATFKCYKGVTSQREKTGQMMYENVFNFIEAPNNDENCPIIKRLIPHCYAASYCYYIRKREIQYMTRLWVRVLRQWLARKRVENISAARLAHGIAIGQIIEFLTKQGNYHCLISYGYSRN